MSVFFGKMDMGHGLHTAVAQMVGDELDVAFKDVTVYMGDTRTSREPGRRVRLDGLATGRHADAQGGRRGAAPAGRDGSG